MTILVTGWLAFGGLLKYQGCDAHKG